MSKFIVKLNNSCLQTSQTIKVPNPDISLCHLYILISILVFKDSKIWLTAINHQTKIKVIYQYQSIRK